MVRRESENDYCDMKIWEYYKGKKANALDTGGVSKIFRLLQPVDYY